MKKLAMPYLRKSKAVKSNFKQDLAKEQWLYPLLDTYYGHLKHYDFKRVHDITEQRAGIDLILTDRRTKKTYFVDEKAQLDYLNEDLPTFAFEIQYSKDGTLRPGWLFDSNKKTQFYALATSIYADEVGKLTSCRLTFVNRHKLLELLEKTGHTSSPITQKSHGRDYRQN